ncbi:hypothetical protein [Chroococcidiopsis sp. CCALA 051]|uniref:hypothetical protein n=1 Tax=Chroococcidiopsis sp. CCALA 051 TaxID=869949 RepID=UPI0018EA8002|nr:hypothetical protein [Chroococcidiopsis sp. CCALA 051]
MMSDRKQIGRLQEKPLGAYLVEAGLITPTQLNMALKEQKDPEKRLGQILVAKGWVKQPTIEYLMAKVVLPERKVGKELFHLDENNSKNLVDRVSTQSHSKLPVCELRFHLSAAKTVRFLLALVFGLIFISLLVQFSLYYLPNYPMRDTVLVPLFNVDGEQNFPALYSCLALLFCAAILATITHEKKVMGDRYTRYWGALAVIFLFLSLDEILSLHEKTLEPVRTALQTGGIFYFAWVIPASVLVVVFALVFLRFLAHLPTGTRNLFVMAGTIYLAGALGMEMISGYYADLYGTESIQYIILVTIEELLEMLGIIVFIYTLLSYMSKYIKGINLQVSASIHDKKFKISV